MCMKRFFLFILLVSIIQIQSQTASSGFTGCPDTWPASGDSKSMTRELEQIRASLGFNVQITSNSYELSKDKVNWISDLKFNDRYAYALTLSGGFGRYVVSIKVANCPTPVLRYYDFKLPVATLGNVVNNYADFFSQEINRRIFGGPRDFVQVETLKPLVDSCITELQSSARENGFENGKPVDRSSSIFAIGLFELPPTQSCRELKNRLERVDLFFTDNDCLRMGGSRSYVYVVAGKECDVVLGALKSSLLGGSTDSVIPLSIFRIKGPDTVASIEAARQAAIDARAAELKARQDARVAAKEAARLARSKTITITCKKGNLTQKIKGTKPKCPKGFSIK
jgi:hypothetical protein